MDAHTEQRVCSGRQQTRSIVCGFQLEAHGVKDVDTYVLCSAGCSCEVLDVKINVAVVESLDYRVETRGQRGDVEHLALEHLERISGLCIIDAFLPFQCPLQCFRGRCSAQSSCVRVRASCCTFRRRRGSALVSAVAS